MNDKLDYIITKIDKITEDVNEIKVLDAEQNAQLAQHMKRSDLLEVRVEQVNDSLKPLQSHVDMVRGGLKLIAIAGTLAALFISLKELL